MSNIPNEFISWTSMQNEKRYHIVSFALFLQIDNTLKWVNHMQKNVYIWNGICPVLADKYVD